MDSMQEALARLEERNRRVEADKAWETSWARRLFLAALTYVFAVLVLRSVGTPNVHWAAVWPPVGYLLSTLSLPPLKRLWLRRRATLGR